jgi:hypothetical protein
MSSYKIAIFAGDGDGEESSRFPYSTNVLVSVLLVIPELN